MTGTEETTAKPAPVFYSDITDVAYRERLKMHNEEIYRYSREQEKQSHVGHMDYAKWLFASLLAVHGGSIYALNSLRTSISPGKGDFLIYAAAQNLTAVFLTLVAGLFAWLNLQLSELYYREAADPALLYRHSYKDDEAKWVDRCMFISAGFGIVSGLLFASSGITVIWGLFTATAGAAQ